MCGNPVVWLVMGMMLWANVCGVFGSLSGFYADNGVDQTIMHRAITEDDAQAVEHEILELLGLPDRPRKKHSHPSLR